MNEVKYLTDDERKEFTCLAGHFQSALPRETASQIADMVPFLARHPDLEFRLLVFKDCVCVFVRENEYAKSVRQDEARKRATEKQKFWNQLTPSLTIFAIFGVFLGLIFMALSGILNYIFGHHLRYGFAFLAGPELLLSLWLLIMCGRFYKIHRSI